MSADAQGWAKMLGLDPEDAARVGRRTWQWARALGSGGGEPDLLEAGALYRLAAGYLLLDPRAGRAAFAEAGAYLRDMSDTYAHALAVCADDRDGLRAAFDAGPDDRLAPTGRAHVMTALAWASVTGAPEARQLYQAHHEVAEAVAPLPANRLRMPLAAIAAVLDAAVRDSPRALATAVDELLSRTDEVFGAAMLDWYHWRHMLSRVMPVEPEIVAPLAVAVAAGYRAEDQVVERRAPALVALGIASSIAADR